ncbi:ribosomal L7Ae/L30e/S12e/Gadd45 family protein [Candidatus Woesearchaeota archaeon]|nr:ribosomal L7Ae/L30e/S12e/Gadd45 family protein [Candidatus Woesearchaeota archaeon]
MTDVIAEIKKLHTEGKLVIGGEETLKCLRGSRLSKIFLAANCKEELKQDIERFASLSGVDIVYTGIQNEDLGDVCKKPFSISIIGVQK